MPTKDLIRQAMEAVGRNKEEDYRLRLREHPDALRTTAPGLVAILESSVVTGTRQQYEKKDEKAGEAQTEFRRIFNRANKLVLVTAILTALVLTVGILSNDLTKLLGEGTTKVLLMALSIGSVAAGAFASKDLYMVRNGKLLEEWMTTRAAAESKRLEYFMDVINADAPQPENGVPADLLKLEYFRRFQLETQICYFDKRGTDNRRDAQKNLSNSGKAVAGAAIVTSSAAISSVSDARLAAIASLGAVFTAFSSYITLKEQIYQNQRIAERYALTLDELQDIYKRMDSVRDAVSQSGREPLLQFVTVVHEKLMAEHKQWLGEQEQRSQSITKLDELLEKAKLKKEGKLQGEPAEQQPAAPLPQQPEDAQVNQDAKAEAQPQAVVQPSQDEQVPEVQNQQPTEADQPDVGETTEADKIQLPEAENQDTGEESREPAEALQPAVVGEAENNVDGFHPQKEVPEIKKDTNLFQ